MSKGEEAVSNRICPQCKRVIDVTWKACPYCGTNLVFGRMLAEVCPHCKRVIEPTWKRCPYCGGNPAQLPPAPSARYETVDNPSWAWYLAPLLFGIIGGLIGYVGTKDRDEGMASNLLIFGIIWTFILGIVSWAWITSIIH